MGGIIQQAVSGIILENGIEGRKLFRQPEKLKSVPSNPVEAKDRIDALRQQLSQLTWWKNITARIRINKEIRTLFKSFNVKQSKNMPSHTDAYLSALEPDMTSDARFQSTLVVPTPAHVPEKGDGTPAPKKWDWAKTPDLVIIGSWTGKR